MMQIDNALSVSELNEYVRRLLAGDPLLRDLEVCGEISGYKHHISGHRYFFLKDAGARVQCVMFRQNAMGLDFQPSDGMRVRVRAAASLYPRDGSYQLYISAMQKAGVGDLYLKFEQLKQKLQKEGLFDPARKRVLPLKPKYVGIVTSQTGAALRDMVRIARRRNPNVGILLAPCAVQGADAAAEIVRSIELLNADGRAEVILCGRGGGSIEDLWAFNEEIVARAIANSRIPLVSCVGHETDFTIADFAADVRAATPSMAAEIAVPVLSELQKSLDGLMLRVKNGLVQGNKIRRAELKRLSASQIFKCPSELLIDSRKSAADALWERCKLAEAELLRSRRTKLANIESSLRALNPSGVLGRGYAYVSRNGAIISSAAEIRAQDALRIHMRDGYADVGTIKTEITEADLHGE